MFIAARQWSLVLICRRCICDVAAGTAWATSRSNGNMRRRQLEPSQNSTAGMPAKLPATSVLISEHYPRQYRRPCHRCIRGMWEPGLSLCTMQEERGCRTSGAVVRPCSSYQNSRRRLKSGTSGVQVWHDDISVKLFRQISLFIHYLYTYLFSKLMIHIYIHFHTNRFSWLRTYSHLLFKKENTVKRSLLLFHFLFIVRGFKFPICIFVGWEVCIQ